MVDFISNIPNYIQSGLYTIQDPFFKLTQSIANNINTPHLNKRSWEDTEPIYTDNGYHAYEINPITGRRGYFPEGEVNRDYRKSILGDLGITKDKNGVYRYYDNGDIVKQCAKFANRYSQAVGRPTAGDAWTTRGIFGDSVLYNNPLGLAIPHDIGANVQNGDIVDLRWLFSPHAKEALKYGRGNSHTGRIFKPNDTDTYVIHNVSGKIKIDPLSNFDVTNNLKNFAITQLRRPFTENDPARKK